MDTAKQRALTALDALHPSMQAREAERLETLATRLEVVRRLVQEGLDDAEAGRVSDWDPLTLGGKVKARR